MIYERIATSFDRINDIISGKLSDNEYRQVMAYEAEILLLVAHDEGTHYDGGMILPDGDAVLDALGKMTIRR